MHQPPPGYGQPPYAPQQHAQHGSPQQHGHAPQQHGHVPHGHPQQHHQQAWHHGYAQPSHHAYPAVALEFSAVDDVALERVGKRTRQWGLTALIGGALMLIIAALAMILPSALDLPKQVAAMILPVAIVSLLPLALVNLGVGVFYMRAAESISAIATTRGHDLPHLMTSLEKLRIAFQIEVAVGALAAVGGFVASFVVRAMA